MTPARPFGTNLQGGALLWPPRLIPGFIPSGGAAPALTYYILARNGAILNTRSGNRIKHR